MTTSLAGLLAVLSSVGCADDVSGRVEATQVGDVIDTPLARVDPTAPMLEACGPPLAEPDMLRRPYLQHVSATEVHLVWVSERPAVESVRVTRLLDEEGRFEGSAVPTVFLSTGEQRHASLTGLTPGDIHCYALYDGDELVFGPVGFRVPPPPGEDRRVDVIAFGDSGSGSDDQAMLRDQMETVPADLILHVGDVVYPAGTLDGYEQYVFDVYGDLFDSIPFAPTPGNHDLGTSAGGPYFEVFELDDDASGTERYYAFDYAHVHFVALDTNDLDAEQLAWLERDLSSTSQPWRIVYGHHPPYSSGFHGSDGAFRARVLPVLQEHGVQLVIAGHDHDYERVEPGDGITYVVSGGGGYSTRLLRSEVEGSRFFEPVTHLVSLHIEDDALRGYAVDATGQVFDSFELAAD